jgi:transcriptional regulator with XRE-family HTH domain
MPDRLDPFLANYEIGQSVARRRQALNLSQDDLGERLGRRQQWVTRKERGGASITVVELVALSVALETRPEQLLRDAGLALWEDDPTPSPSPEETGRIPETATPNS